MITKVAKALNLKVNQVETVQQLASEGATIPFMARYRKEMTGNLDEVEIKAILDALQYEESLQKRKTDVLAKLEELEKNTPELTKALEAATTLQQVEDIYLPYRPKRRTKAEQGREKGLQPLADWFRDKSPYSTDVVEELSKGVALEEALPLVHAIIGEEWGEEAKLRQMLRDRVRKEGLLRSKKKKQVEDEKEIFAQYYEYEEKIAGIVPHRVLALNRGERTDVLQVKVIFDETRFMDQALRTYERLPKEKREVVEAAVTEAYKKSVFPAIEREIRGELTDKAEEQAIDVFSKNLIPPLREVVVLGIDPAYRTGCKWAVVNEIGKVEEVGVFYPTAPKHDIDGAEKVLTRLAKKYPISVIVVGNGTASRETEQFVADWLKKAEREIAYAIVNEAGASVYSASEVARSEFPDLKVEERSAVSIARRIQDAMAELVKVDPQSVGVGQYQHDVSQNKLKASLEFVVESVVNMVGIDVNRASESLLTYVSGLNKTTAKNIVAYREENGRFETRKEIKKVPRLGAKAFEQAAGFLRIMNGKDVLDQTEIHPESYSLALSILKEIGSSKAEVGTAALRERLQQVDANVLSERLDAGVPTVEDILKSLAKPGRDPREDIQKPLLRTDVMSLEDLQVGMEFQGTVRNVIDFGAFVDIGVKQDGLVHISKLSNRYVKHPLDVVAVGDIVTVWIEQVDVNRGRISLTMLEPNT
ncbi:Tex family protein [Exiguobacterium sp. B2(2022)]|uniref:Tex family protein n=1 Tax=Exiguobacterium sp. B2(2022) TaxID=2992755 RepID=UPI00237B217F|nr:Tex family protein [Exiguobacterium sp. B2(2022)]MDE0564645.1 RNA-binding transcriptional accessory protein [Exiguobacterium sp. B2(2022)]